MSIKKKHSITPDFFHSVVKALDGLVAIIDKSFRLISFNQSFSEDFNSLYSIKAEEGLCLKDFFIKYPDDFNTIKNLVDLAFTGKNLESSFMPGASSCKSYYLKLKPVYDNNNQVIAAIFNATPENNKNNHFNNFTNKKSAKKFVRISKELYEGDKPHKIISSLLENIPSGLLVADSQGKINMASRTILEWLNLKPEEILGKQENLQKWNIIKYDKSEIKESPLQQALLYKKTTKDEEYVIQQGKGKELIISVEANPVFDDENNLIGAISTWMDISKRVTSEKEMRNSYKFPAENPNPIIRINREGKILYVNLSGRKIDGSVSFTVGKRISEPFKTLSDEAFISNRQITTEVNCGPKIYSFVIVPLKESGYINLYGNDITERKKAEKEIVSIKNDLSRAQQVGLIGSWRYHPLDCVKSAQLAYDSYPGHGCMYAVSNAIISQLADKNGSPYDQFPVNMLNYGHGGAGGYGALCGALNGGAMLIGLFCYAKKERDTMISNLYQWYEQTELPVFVPKNSKFKDEMPTASTNSVLCHASVSNWCMKAMVSPDDSCRKERCRRLCCDVVMKVIELLDAYIQDEIAVFQLSTESNECMECHGIDEAKMFKTKTKMSCGSCHSDPHNL